MTRLEGEGQSCKEGNKTRSIKLSGKEKKRNRKKKRARKNAKLRAALK